MSWTPSHPGIYDDIGRSYARLRVPDPRIAEAIRIELGEARRICNVGAGTGSYEPSDGVVAVEPSERMIAQRPPGTPVVRAVAEALPFEDDRFDAALAILTVHHWRDPRAGLRELCRIAPRRVVFTFDPDMQAHFWLVRDYLPEIASLERDRALRLELLIDGLGGARVTAVPVPWDCSDGFQAAYWRRPERYLDPQVRACISTLSQLPRPCVERAMERLATDLESGEWRRRNAGLLDRESVDWGYRLLTSPA